MQKKFYKNKTMETNSPTHLCEVHQLVRGSQVYEVLNSAENKIESRCFICLKERHKQNILADLQDEITNYDKRINSYRADCLGLNVLALSILIIGLWFLIPIFIEHYKYNYFLYEDILPITIIILILGIPWWIKDYICKKLKSKIGKNPQGGINFTATTYASLELAEEKLKVDLFKKELEEIKRLENIKIDYSLMEIDSMNGIEFEHFIRDSLAKLGYKNAEVTKASGDGGVDIIAENDHQKVAIQCKRYGGNVGSQAVSEVYKGKDLHNCDKAIIITNSNFTQQAISEAKQLGIHLINRSGLAELIKKAANDNTSPPAIEKTTIKLELPIEKNIKIEMPNEVIKWEEELTIEKQISEFEEIENDSPYTPEEYEQLLNSILENFEEKLYDIGNIIYYDLDIETDFYLEDHIHKLLICGSIAIVTYHYNNSYQPYYFELASSYVKNKFGNEYEDIFIYKFFSNRKWVNINEINTQTFWEIATLIYDSSYLFTEKEVIFIKTIKDILEEHTMMLLQYEMS